MGCPGWLRSGADGHSADGPQEKALTARLRELDEKDLKTEGDAARLFPRMLSQAARSRRDAANRRDFEAWKAVRSRRWERFRAPRLRALRASLGSFPPVPHALKVRVTGTLEGEGYRIEKLIFQSRPGLWVTANLYLPKEARTADAGLPPVSQPSQSQNAGRTAGHGRRRGRGWAALVLVLDQLGHGERRQHPFVDARSYAGRFRPSSRIITSATTKACSFP